MARSLPLALSLDEAARLLTMGKGPVILRGLLTSADGSLTLENPELWTDGENRFAMGECGMGYSSYALTGNERHTPQKKEKGRARNR